MNTSQTEVSSTNSSVFKLSPLKKLSPEQSVLKQKVIGFCRTHVRAGSPALFVIRGRAGTGKSVVLSAVFNEIQNLSRSGAPDDPVFHTDNRLIVNHAEMFKLYRELSEDLPNVRKKDIERPTPFINRLDRNHQTADIVLVDEAHLLLTKRDPYNKFNQENQLMEIIRRSRVVILVFDDRQVLKMKSYWNDAGLQHIITRFPSETYRLTRQFRMHAAPDVSEWISGFIHKKLLPLPKKQAFDFRIFEDAGDMYHLIKERNSACGLSRMIATYDYPYKLDGQDHFIHEKNFTLRWDRSKPTERKPWAERPESIAEVGSVYTIQGFDLNYAGVILGPSVIYDERRDRIVIDAQKYEDQAAFTRRDDVLHPEMIKEQIILNSINVLLTRGMYGLYIYASNPELREKLATL
jgi:DUF2075 family protein